MVVTVRLLLLLHRQHVSLIRLLKWNNKQARAKIPCEYVYYYFVCV